MMRYAFINADGIVVQTLRGDLSPLMQAQFLADYDVLFAATDIVPISDPDIQVWIGGTYTDGQFNPPAPEPQPEPLPEPEQEPEPEI